MLFVPLCKVALPVNTPLPTATGCPSIWTVASFGVTVPCTLIVFVLTTAPLAGDATWRTTAPEAAWVLVLVLVFDEPQPAKTIAKIAAKPV